MLMALLQIDWLLQPPAPVLPEKHSRSCAPVTQKYYQGEQVKTEVY